MPLTSPIPGGPPQGPHRPLEEETAPMIPEKNKLIEKLPSERFTLSRFANWVSQAFYNIFS